MRPYASFWSAVGFDSRARVHDICAEAAEMQAAMRVVVESRIVAAYGRCYGEGAIVKERDETTL